MKALWKKFINWLKNYFSKVERVPIEITAKGDIKPERKKKNKHFKNRGLLLWDSRRGTFRRAGLRLGQMRNKLCPCGSDIKFKKCCWMKK